MIYSLYTLGYILISAAVFYVITWYNIKYVDPVYKRSWNVSSSFISLLWPLGLPMYVLVQSVSVFIDFTLRSNNIKEIEEDNDDDDHPDMSDL